MQDFNDFINNGLGEDSNFNQSSVFNTVSSIAKKFDGKNTNDLIKAIYEEAKKGKQRGTLTDRDIDNFATMLSPMLDQKQLKILNKVIADLKKI